MAQDGDLEIFTAKSGYLKKLKAVRLASGLARPRMIGQARRQHTRHAWAEWGYAQPQLFLSWIYKFSGSNSRINICRSLDLFSHFVRISPKTLRWWVENGRGGLPILNPTNSSNGQKKFRDRFGPRLHLCVPDAWRWLEQQAAWSPFVQVEDSSITTFLNCPSILALVSFATDYSPSFTRTGNQDILGGYIFLRIIHQILGPQKPLKLESWSAPDQDRRVEQMMPFHLLLLTLVRVKSILNMMINIITNFLHQSSLRIGTMLLSIMIPLDLSMINPQEWQARGFSNPCKRFFRPAKWNTNRAVSRLRSYPGESSMFIQNWMDPLRFMFLVNTRGMST